jgi:hypothetical protein
MYILRTQAVRRVPIARRARGPGGCPCSARCANSRVGPPPVRHAVRLARCGVPDAGRPASRPPPAVSPRRARARPVRLGLSSPIGGVVSAIIDVLMYAQAVFSPSEVFAVYPFAHPPFFISHHVTVLGPAPNSTALWEKCIPWGSQKSARHTSS